MTALEIRDLHVRRGGIEVVHGIDLTVAAGEITALLGTNGAGKSSTVLAVAGIARDTSGSITTDGAGVRGLAPNRVRRAGIATMQEGHRVFGDISVADNLAIAALLLPRHERAEAVAEMLDLFPEMHGFADRPAGSLSGGQQQMLALATALAARPKVLVIDEMSLGLAPLVVARLVPALRAVAERGVGVLLIEQFTSVALELATSVTVLAQGLVTLRAPAAELRDHPERLSAAYRLTEQ
ncbi:ABC transporter ATP-binding protein [Myceligenerans xiligouense]|uniref:Amino acid/amide ABC transporter ATP-binding protein 2 (HAAT family) n=1 Tax=Myceligenerans xiligouense TaxID=253184 RepID=A0A3N4ZPS4_9MICO|nr:ATP-binding cassette domain-containing protein [Myceligenerans xiligouense]RPF21861.1 amino acid/amide ABC transporter ATP-binding protein 2 (HAAT family) [Myceligenerans xiligouense]